MYQVVVLARNSTRLRGFERNGIFGRERVRRRIAKAGQILRALPGGLLLPFRVTKLLKVEIFYADPLRRISNPFYLRTAIRKHHHNASLYYIHQTNRVRIIAPPEQWFLR